MRAFRIGGETITDISKSYVIAEIGHNHQGSLKKCKDMFKAAAEAGADAVKLQKRDNHGLFTRHMYDSPYNSENAFGPTYGAHREALEFGREEYLALKAYADVLGILFFATAFDVPSADFLEDIDMPAYKIASGDLANPELLKRVASFGKPIIVSTGGGTLDDARRACDTVLGENSNLCLMQCTSGYPPANEELNLRVIETFRDEFPNVVIGFSSHDSGIVMPVVGYLLGARVFEKHFTLNRAWKGTDQAFSLEPAGLRRVIRDLERTRVALGDGVKRPYPSETASLNKMVKRLVAARNLKAGTTLTAADIAYKIPETRRLDGRELAACEAEWLIGQTLVVDVASDDLLTYSETGMTAEQRASMDCP